MSPHGGEPIGAEAERLQAARERSTPGNCGGPYLSERQWGTVREDYSDNGDAWKDFTHDQARSRAYRWGEDGLAVNRSPPTHPRPSGRRGSGPDHG